VQRRLSAGFRVGAAVTGAVLLLTTACSGDDGRDKGGVTVGGTVEPGAPQVTVTPANGERKARPDKGVTVKSAGGDLESVSVTRKGRAVSGKLSSDKTTWKSGRLRPDTRYQVTATARSPRGKASTVTSTFTTLKPAAELEIIDVTPMAGETVGVGMPITVVFNRPVENKKAVERALRVRSTKPATGAWFWAAANTAIFRTENGEYWDPNQQVTFSARLTGVRAGRSTYGTDDFSRRFTIGDSHIVNISTKTKRAVVRENGRTVKSWPISAGKGGRMRGGVDVFLTTSGIHLTMGKENPAIMTSEWMGVDPKDKKNGGYREVIPHAVRISHSGEFIHSMASTVWAQGRQNVSHGCINSPPAAARWFYDYSYRGDPVIITGSKRELEWNNGWSYYQMPWSSWVAGGALDRTVRTG
jgi:lipoprotein-anchoring transpeptidase ErfK/SrfK